MTRLSTLIRADLDRFAETYRLRGQRYSKTRILFESIIFKPGFQAVLLYRIAHALFRHHWHYAAWFVSRLNQMLTGAEIEFNATIGPGLFIAHPAGIVVGRGTQLGAYATLFQNVTFGARSWHPNDIGRFPRVGDNCFFCASAVVVGPIDIGDNCVIAAGSVVTCDVQTGSLAVGVPAQDRPGRGASLLVSWGLLTSAEGAATSEPRSGWVGDTIGATPTVADTAPETERAARN